MTRCSVQGCSSDSGDGKSLFVIPKDPAARAKWMRFLIASGRTVQDKVGYRICGDHFRPQDVKPGAIYNRLIPGSFPRTNLMRPQDKGSNSEDKAAGSSADVIDSDGPEEKLLTDGEDEDDYPEMVHEISGDTDDLEKEQPEYNEEKNKMKIFKLTDSENQKELEEERLDENISLSSESLVFPLSSGTSESSDDGTIPAVVRKSPPLKTKQKFPQIMGQTTIRSISVKKVIDQAAPVLLKNESTSGSSHKPRQPQNIEVFDSDDSDLSSSTAEENDGKQSIIKTLAVPTRRTSTALTNVELAKLPSGVYTITSNSTKKRRLTIANPSKLTKAIVYPENYQEEPKNIPSVNPLCAMSPPVSTFVVPAKKTYLKTDSPLLAEDLFTIDDSNATQPETSDNANIKRQPETIRYVVPQDMLASSRDRIKKVIPSSSSSESSEMGNYDGDLFVMEDDKKLESQSETPPLPNSKKRRKDFLIPKFDQDQEPPFEIPSRPQINIDLIENLAKCRVLVRNILKKINVPEIDFKDPSDEYINMYKILKD